MIVCSSESLYGRELAPSWNYLMVKNVRIKHAALCPWVLSAWAVTGLGGVCLCMQGEMATHNTEWDLMASRCVCLKTQQTLPGRSLLKRTWTKQTVSDCQGKKRREQGWATESFFFFFFYSLITNRRTMLKIPWQKAKFTCTNSLNELDGRRDKHEEMNRTSG